MSEESTLIKDETVNSTAEVSEKAPEPSDHAAETAGFSDKPVQEQETASQSKRVPEDDFLNEDIPEKKRFHFKKDDKEFFRDKWILSRISDENLMEYLKLEQRRSELQQEAKNIKEKRILKAFEMTIGLAAIVAVTYLLRDNPTILVNILYIAGILAAFWVWKNPKDK